MASDVNIQYQGKGELSKQGRCWKYLYFPGLKQQQPSSAWPYWAKRGEDFNSFKYGHFIIPISVCDH